MIQDPTLRGPHNFKFFTTKTRTTNLSNTKRRKRDIKPGGEVHTWELPSKWLIAHIWRIAKEPPRGFAGSTRLLVLQHRSYSGENQCLRARPARIYTSSTQSDLHTTIIISAPVFTDLAEPLSSAVALTRLHFFSRRRPSLAHYGTIIAYHWLCLLVTHTDPLVPLSFMPRWLRVAFGHRYALPWQPGELSSLAVSATES